MAKAKLLFPTAFVNDPRARQTTKNGSHGRIRFVGDGKVRKEPLTTDDGESVNDLRREVAAYHLMASSGSRHPFVVTHFELSVPHAPLPSVTMEELPKGLLEFLREAPTAERAVDLAVDIADALDYLHNDVGMLHLDIRESNVRCAGRHPKLFDFSSAIPITADEATRAAVLKRNTFVKADPALEHRHGEFGTEIDVFFFGKILDGLLDAIPDEERRLVRGCVKVVNDCCDPHWQKRPSAAQILGRLRECRQMLRIAESNGDDQLVEAAASPVQPASPSPTLAAQANAPSWEERLAENDAAACTLWGNPMDAVGIVTVNTKNLSPKKEYAERFAALVRFVLNSKARIVMIQELRSAGENDGCSALQDALNESADAHTWTVLPATHSTDRAGRRRDLETIAFANERNPSSTGSLPIACTSYRRLCFSPQDAAAWSREPFFAALRVGRTKLLAASVHFNPTKPTKEQAPYPPGAAGSRLCRGNEEHVGGVH